MPDLHKCDNCGRTVPSFTFQNCPSLVVDDVSEEGYSQKLYFCSFACKAEFLKGGEPVH